MKTYKVTFGNQFKGLSGLLLFTLMTVACVFIIFRTFDSSEGLFLIFGIGYLFSFIPVLFLHIEYYFKNRNDSVGINASEEIILINQNQKIPFSDIDKITYVMPPVWHRKGIIRFFPFEDYHFAIIKLKSGENFVFTCLMAYRVEDALMQIKGVPVEKKKRLIATTLY